MSLYNLEKNFGFPAYISEETPKSKLKKVTGGKNNTNLLDAIDYLESEIVENNEVTQKKESKDDITIDDSEETDKSEETDNQ